MKEIHYEKTVCISCRSPYPVCLFQHMDLESGTSLNETPVNIVFIGPCSNSHIEDLREAAVKGRKMLECVIISVTHPSPT